MRTEDLIEKLAHHLEPAQPLAAPSRRAAGWFGAALLYMALLVLAIGAMSGAGEPLEATSWIAQSAAIATSFLACLAAFASVIPGLGSRAPAAAATAATVWLATLVLASPAPVDWTAVATARHEWKCVAFIAAGGAPLAAAITWMLRRGAPVRPATTAALVALAVATLANVGACFSLPHANGAVTFAWHGGVVAAAVMLAFVGGRWLFTWRFVR
jgi:hypothetical protein